LKNKELGQGTLLVLVGRFHVVPVVVVRSAKNVPYATEFPA